MPAARACAAPRGAPRAGKAAKAAATRNVRVNGGGEYGASGSGLHSFRFQLNLSSSVHRVTQLNS